MAARGAGLLIGVGCRLGSPSFWRRTTVRALSEQVVLVGVGSLRFVSVVAVVAGLTVVLQAQVWLAAVGQSKLIGPFLASVLIREVAPLLVGFILIGRTGAALVAELWTMRQRGEVHALDAQGIDPFDYLVVPRVAATTFAGLALVLAFVAIALASGYLVGFAGGAIRLPLLAFLDDVLADLTGRDVTIAALKAVAPAAITAVCACQEALDDVAPAEDLPRAVQRAYARSVLGLVAVFAMSTVWLYLL